MKWYFVVFLVKTNYCLISGVSGEIRRELQLVQFRERVATVMKKVKQSLGRDVTEEIQLNSKGTQTPAFKCGPCEERLATEEDEALLRLYLGGGPAPRGHDMGKDDRV